MFKDKAVMIADKLLPAFNTPTGIPMAMVNVRTYVCLCVCLNMLISHRLLRYSVTTMQIHILLKLISV